MSPALIAGAIGLALLAALGVTGKLLLDAHETIGNQKVELRDKQAIIDQTKHDADLSEQLATLQTKVETALKNTGAQTRQAITNAPNDNDAAAAAIAGVLRLRAGERPGPPAP